MCVCHNVQESTSRVGVCQVLELSSSYGQGVPYDPTAFGRRLAAARVWAGLEPKQLAAALGYHAETINRLERGVGKRPPTRPVLEALAAAVQQTPEWLLEGPEPPWSSREQASRQSEIIRLLERLEAEVEKFERANEVFAKRQADLPHPVPNEPRVAQG